MHLKNHACINSDALPKHALHMRALRCLWYASLSVVTFLKRCRLELHGGHVALFRLTHSFFKSRTHFSNHIIPLPVNGGSFDVN